MKEYKKGQKFKVCGHDELLKKGWKQDGPPSSAFEHKDFPESVIVTNMLKSYTGKTLTVKKRDYKTNWYYVEENKYIWPVATFEIATFEITFGCSDGCKEGITPIDGWIICKTCGTNLRKIR